MYTQLPISLRVSDFTWPFTMENCRRGSVQDVAMAIHADFFTQKLQLSIEDRQMNATKIISALCFQNWTSFCVLPCSY